MSCAVSPDNLNDLRCTEEKGLWQEIRVAFSVIVTFFFHINNKWWAPGILNSLFQETKVLVVGWSEPAATNAPAEDEAVEVVLGMNQNHILLAQIYIIFPASILPQNIFLLPTYLLPLTYLLPTSPLLPPTFPLLPPTYLPRPTFDRHC
jgi:hypothetical protein